MDMEDGPIGARPPCWASTGANGQVQADKVQLVIAHGFAQRIIHRPEIVETVRLKRLHDATLFGFVKLRKRKQLAISQIVTGLGSFP